MNWLKRALGIQATLRLPGQGPVKLERGGVYVIESDHELSEDDVIDIYAYLSRFKKATGCEFLLLDAGLHVALSDPAEREG